MIMGTRELSIQSHAGSVSIATVGDTLREPGGFIGLIRYFTLDLCAQTHVPGSP